MFNLKPGTIITIIVVIFAIIFTIVFYFKKRDSESSEVVRKLSKQEQDKIICNAIKCKSKLKASKRYGKYCKFHSYIIIKKEFLEKKGNPDPKKIIKLDKILNQDAKELTKKEQEQILKNI